MEKTRLNLVNKTFGFLFVTGEAFRKDYKSYYIARCKCGKESVVRQDHLIRGKIKSCGCLQRATYNDQLIGKTYGRLTVIKFAGVRDHQQGYFLCKCKCGNLTKVRGCELTNNKGTKSCGCLQREIAREWAKIHKTIHGQSKTKSYRSLQDGKRRLKIKNSTGTFNEQQIKALYKVQKGRCAECRVSIAYEKIHRDHIMPLALNGTNHISNIQLLCPSCNLRKGAMHPITWAQKHGRLL